MHHLISKLSWLLSGMYSDCADYLRFSRHGDDAQLKISRKIVKTSSIFVHNSQINNFREMGQTPQWSFGQNVSGQQILSQTGNV